MDHRHHLLSRSGSLTMDQLGIEVRQMDEFSLTLLIPHLSASHAGNYTCEATNAARTATYTAPLNVSGNVSPVCVCVVTQNAPTTTTCPKMHRT